MRYFVYCRKSSEAEDRQILSISSQRAELDKVFRQRADCVIVGVYEEAQSAKSPGRPLFDEMLARIERREAQGIIAWDPDRLARNSVDGGRIIHMLDCGLLKDLRFSTFAFQNNSQGKLMLSMLFGYSKYYVDALSENVKRGNRTKLALGWRPGPAPIGYLNDRASKTIIPDPERFQLVRRMWELALTGSHSPRDIWIRARREWGLTTAPRRRSGGKPLALSAVYTIFKNCFYAGLIPWTGQVHAGKHEPMITLAEFDRVQGLLANPSAPRPQTYTFPYTGLIRCGACGLSVTAEHKRNRDGRRYIYYHCTRRLRPDGTRCKQPSIEARALESSFCDFMSQLELAPELHAWAAKQVGRTAAARREQAVAEQQSLAKALAANERAMQTLLSLRLRELIDDEEFSNQRLALQEEAVRLQESRAAAEKRHSALEHAPEFEMFKRRAAEWFRCGDTATKRSIIQIVSSNLLLTDGILRIRAAKPFRAGAEIGTFPEGLAVVEDVRTALTNAEVDDCLYRIRFLEREWKKAA